MGTFKRVHKTTMDTKIDLVSKLDAERRQIERWRLRSVSPDTGKYGAYSEPLEPYLSPEAEWKMFAQVQRALLETRVKFGQAKPEHLKELDRAMEEFDPLNASLIETDRDLKINHDQLAVLEELGNHLSEEVKALLHPGTTSYDIVDTSRAYLLREAWKQVIRPKAVEVITALCVASEEQEEVIQAGRTHLQKTSPVPISMTFALYAARMAERTERCDQAFTTLKGKVSGM